MFTLFSFSGECLLSGDFFFVFFGIRLMNFKNIFGPKLQPPPIATPPTCHLLSFPKKKKEINFHRNGGIKKKEEKIVQHPWLCL